MPVLFKNSWPWLLALFLLGIASTAAHEDDLGFRVAPGFRVTVYADESLANDIYAMALDAHGRVVVTSRGWIKVLHDSKGVGRADTATIFAKTPTGGMGLCFDENDLYFCGDDWVMRYRDSKGNGIADGPPEKLFPLAFTEHGGHAIRKGPDGWFYVIGGNSSEIKPNHITMPSSPIKYPEAGGLIRFSPDGKNREVIAHGFRNPYDFDFNSFGDIFTYDSDNEEDFFMPWYMPTRLYHVSYGGHHGWKLGGIKRSWGRPDYYCDTVSMLWPVGRGSPTGVTCYRHTAFPEHYRNGLFALDWTFGKVYFFPLEPDGCSYKTKPEVFLESTGAHGFDPTDIEVAPDGSLLICMGGRGTRGAVYRVAYEQSLKNPAATTDPLESLLTAPQPLAAWSRHQWLPKAKALGKERFEVFLSEHPLETQKGIRVLEILTEVFGGVGPEACQSILAHGEAPLKSRLAWSLGLSDSLEPRQRTALLEKLTSDSDPRVVLASLEALGRRSSESNPGKIRRLILKCLATPDKRIRQAAAHLASGLAESEFKSLSEEVNRAGDLSKLAFALAAEKRNASPGIHESTIEMCLPILDDLKTHPNRDHCLEAARLLILALGDFELVKPPLEAYSPYSVRTDLANHQETAKRLLERIRPLFPTGDHAVDMELSRLLAILEDDDAGSLKKIAALWSPRSSPTDDFHYLIVFSRLRGTRSREQTESVADVLLNLDRKLDQWQMRIKQNWGIRVPEITAKLMERDPDLTSALCRHPLLVRPANASLALLMDPDQRHSAASKFLNAVKANAEFPWSIPLVELLATLPEAEYVPVFREQWQNLGLRDVLVKHLARRPQKEDRRRFLEGLDSTQADVLKACLDSLNQLPRDTTGENLLPLLRLLRRLESEPGSQMLRAKIVGLFNRQTGLTLSIQETNHDAATVAKVYRPVFDAFRKNYPDLTSRLDGSARDQDHWLPRLESIKWNEGDAKKGEKLFNDRACVTCHAGPSRLGPDLTGATLRFSVQDLFTAIIDPSRDVAPAYRVTMIETPSGLVHTGIVIYESAEGVILQTGPAQTIRLPAKEITSRQPSTRSLMPEGLLKDLKENDLADLYAYLKSLRPNSP